MSYSIHYLPPELDMVLSFELSLIRSCFFPVQLLVRIEEVWFYAPILLLVVMDGGGGSTGLLKRKASREDLRQ